MDFLDPAPISRRHFLRNTAATAGAFAANGLVARTVFADNHAVSFPEPHFVQTNGIRMAVYERGEGLPVVFCHGFPQLAFSWRNQLGAFADGGYRAIAPDMRGYGLTDRPKPVEAYNLAELTADMVGMLDALDIDRAVFCGHDWGAQVMWHMPLFHPDRTLGIISINSSLSLRTRTAPIQLMRNLRGEDDYMVQFQELETPETALSKDVRKTIRVFTQDYSAETFGAVPEGEDPWKFDPLLFLLDDEISGRPTMSEDELNRFADAFEQTGFSGGLNWYRNIDRNWELTENVAREVHVPALYVGRRTGLSFRGRRAESAAPDLENHTIKDWGHWSLYDRSDVFNEIAMDWIPRKFG